MTIPYLRARRPDLWEQIMRTLDIQGPLPDAITPSMEVSIQALDLTDELYLWDRRTRRFFAGTVLGAAAGFNGRFELVLTAPDTICKVSLTVFNTNAVAASFGLEQLFAASAMAALGRRQNADLRQPVNTATGAPLPAVSVTASAGLAAGPGAGAVQINLPAGKFFTFPAVILDADLPATGLGVGGLGVLSLVTGIVNSGMGAFVEWTERVKSPQE